MHNNNVVGLMQVGTGTYGSEVWFADEMTPQYTWTWGGLHSFAAAAIRYHCWRHCRCESPVKGKLDNGTTVRPSSLQKMWNVIDDAAVHFGLSQLADGSLTARRAQMGGPTWGRCCRRRQGRAPQLRPAERMGGSSVPRSGLRSL